MILHHFSCQHSGPKIIEDGLVVPHRQPVLGDLKLSWWTDDPTLSKEALGLQSTTLTCDRMTYHFMAGVPDDPMDSPWPMPFYEPWLDFRRNLLPSWAHEISQLEFGRAPRRWFVSRYPIEWREYGV